MKTLLTFALAALTQLATTSAAAQTAPAAPAPAAAMPQPPEVAARQFLLIDLSSQQVLAEREADARAEPASLTKLMTAYLVFNALRDGKLAPTQALAVSRRAWDERRGGASVMFIDPKMKPTVDELLLGLIVQSGNDAAVALAEGVSGSVEAFVQAMNAQAQAWGLKNTQYRNVTGITEAGHYSSARDVAFVAARIIADHPERFALYSVKSFTFNGIKQDNRNRLLGRDASVDGMKTGRTDAAGWCLVATAKRPSAIGDRRLLTVVLGTAGDEARASDSLKLLNWGYGAWDAVRLFDAKAAPAAPTRVRVWKGTAPEVRLGPAAPLVLTVPHGEGARLKTSAEHPPSLTAPLPAGHRAGTLRITTAAGAPVAAVPLVTLEEVPAAGWLGRAWDTLRMSMP